MGIRQMIRAHFQNSPKIEPADGAPEPVERNDTATYMVKEREKKREREIENLERDLIRKRKCAQLLAYAFGYLIANCNLMQSLNEQASDRCGASARIFLTRCSLLRFSLLMRLFCNYRLSRYRQ